MRPIEQDQIQPLLLDTIKVFQAYCQRKGVDFFLFGGSCLGAIRHQGFIPWDDDIDVALLPDQADKLAELVAQDPYIDEERRYRIFLPAEMPNFYPFMKVVDTKTLVYERNIKRKYATGLWVDIFRLGYWPESMEESEALYARDHKLRETSKILVCGDLKDASYKRIYPAVCVGKALLRLTGSTVEGNSEKIRELGGGDKTDWLGNVCWAVGVRERCPKEWFASTVDMPFEDATLPVMVGHHEYLSQIYGDYMQLPPVEKQIRHDFEAYFLDEQEG